MYENTYPWRPERFVTDAELAAITAIFRAYMACNAAAGPLEWEVSEQGSQIADIPVSAMGYLAMAGRRSWRAVGVTDADLWSVMIDSGEDAEYVYRLYLDNAL